MSEYVPCVLLRVTTICGCDNCYEYFWDREPCLAILPFTTVYESHNCYQYLRHSGIKITMSDHQADLHLDTGVLLIHLNPFTQSIFHIIFSWIFLFSSMYIIASVIFGVLLFIFCKHGKWYHILFSLKIASFKKKKNC